MGHCELDRNAERSYRALFDTKGEWYCEDIRNAEPEQLPEFDLLCGGFPCQSFSVAGHRGGFSDPRGTLFFELARLAEARKPAYLLFENVPGLLYHDCGRTFAAILHELEGMGYATRSYTVSDTRTYTNLAYNDPSLIPQAVEKNGLTLALTGVTWHGEGGTGANGSLIPTSYTATASYSGTGSTRYATGYLTTADYAGTVTKTVTEKILYEVEYRGTPIPEPEPEPQEENPSLPLWIPIGAGAVLLGGGTAGAVLAVRKRRNLTR